MPTVAHVGISRQIARDRERKRLRSIANEMRPAGGGFIVRTAAEGVSRKLLRHDMGVLVRLWNRIMERYDRVESPSRLYEDLDLILRATRDLATANLDRLVVDSREEYDRIMTFIEHVMPKFASRAELYVGSEPIFDAYGLEEELKNALSRTVQLPSGGYLVIEKTEALTSIDINTGRFVGKKNLEQTIVKTNIEAAHEIAYQLKLRNIGGLVIIDFIDMDEAANRRRVESELDKAFAGDRGRVKISSISEFGLVELSRKRTRESLEQMLCEPCDHCDGVGIVKSRETVACELLRALHRDLSFIDGHDVHVLAHPHVTTLLMGRERDSLRELELRFDKKLHVKPDGARQLTEFDIADVGARSAKRSKSANNGRR
jgi:ribonuclease G